MSGRRGRKPTKSSSRSGGARRSAASRAGKTRAHGGRPQDHFGEQARKDGFPSRAVYKLEEIDRRIQLLRRGQRVLDLGAAPGSWSLYASKKVGREGRVVGIDLQEIRVAPPDNVSFLTVDMREVGSEDLPDSGRFDVVLSDMAPRTSGMRHRDQFLSYELFILALETADRLLEPGGTFVGKIFQGAEFPDARKALAERFERSRIIKPEASRDESYEVFLVGLGMRDARARTAAGEAPSGGETD